MIKTPRRAPLIPKAGSLKKEVIQTTLHSLSGVVVIEDLIRAKLVLESKQETSESKVAILKELKCKNPSTALLGEVGIGKTIRKLSKLEKEEVEGEGGAEVIQLAKIVYRKWKETVERRVVLSNTKITVRSDKETETRRSAAVSLLEVSLLKDCDSSSTGKRKKLARNVENEIFSVCNKLINNQYRRLTRKVVFGLRDAKVRCELLKCPNSVGEIVRSYLKPSDKR